jgi:hypothetical protein
MNVQRDRSDRIVRVKRRVLNAKLFRQRARHFSLNSSLFYSSPSECSVRLSGRLSALERHQPLPFARDNQLRIVDQRHTMLRSESLSPQTNKVNVRRLLEHQPCRLDGISQSLDTSDTASTKIGAVHQQGIELNPSIASEKRTAPGVEGIIVFHYSDSRLDRINGGPAAGEH